MKGNQITAAIIAALIASKSAQSKMNKKSNITGSRSKVQNRSIFFFDEWISQFGSVDDLWIPAYFYMHLSPIGDSKCSPTIDTSRGMIHTTDSFGDAIYSPEISGAVSKFSIGTTYSLPYEDYQFIEHFKNRPLTPIEFFSKERLIDFHPENPKIKWLKSIGTSMREFGKMFFMPTFTEAENYHKITTKWMPIHQLIRADIPEAVKNTETGKIISKIHDDLFQYEEAFRYGVISPSHLNNVGMSKSIGDQMKPYAGMGGAFDSFDESKASEIFVEFVRANIGLYTDKPLKKIIKKSYKKFKESEQKPWAKFNMSRIVPIPFMSQVAKRMIDAPHPYAKVSNLTIAYNKNLVKTPAKLKDEFGVTNKIIKLIVKNYQEQQIDTVESLRNQGINVVHVNPEIHAIISESLPDNLTDYANDSYMNGIDDEPMTEAYMNYILDPHMDAMLDHEEFIYETLVPAGFGYSMAKEILLKPSDAGSRDFFYSKIDLIDPSFNKYTLKSEQTAVMIDMFVSNMSNIQEWARYDAAKNQMSVLDNIERYNNIYEIMRELVIYSIRLNIPHVIPVIDHYFNQGGMHQVALGGFSNQAVDNIISNRPNNFGEFVSTIGVIDDFLSIDLYKVKHTAELANLSKICSHCIGLTEEYELNMVSGKQVHYTINISIDGSSKKFVLYTTTVNEGLKIDQVKGQNDRIPLQGIHTKNQKINDMAVNLSYDDLFNIGQYISEQERISTQANNDIVSSIVNRIKSGALQPNQAPKIKHIYAANMLIDFKPDWIDWMWDQAEEQGKVFDEDKLSEEDKINSVHLFMMENLEIYEYLIRESVDLIDSENLLNPELNLEYTYRDVISAYLLKKQRDGLFADDEKGIIMGYIDIIGADPIKQISSDIALITKQMIQRG